jgi:tetratricopeptide (TPR) repeat protein
MFGKSKPPIKKMMEYSAEDKYHDGLRLATAYMKKTKKPIKEHDPDFLNQFAGLLYNADCLVAALDIINEIPENWRGYHIVLGLKGRCLLEMGKFDEAEEVFVNLFNMAQEDYTRMKTYGLANNLSNDMITALTQEVYQNALYAHTFAGVIDYARDFSPETAIHTFDKVLEQNPKFELALALKNDIITMQKGGIGQFLLSITEIKEQKAERRGKNPLRGTGVSPWTILGKFGEGAGISPTEIDEKNAFTTIVNEYK